MAQQHRAPAPCMSQVCEGSTGADKGREKLRRSIMEAFESPPMHGASVASMDLPGGRHVVRESGDAAPVYQICNPAVSLEPT
jgi:hypothetical protein